MTYLAAFALIFAVNLLPAFGPPSWALLVLLRLNWHLNPVALVLLGAVAAGAGRYLLALGTRACRGKLSDRRRANLAAAQQTLTGHRAGAAVGIGLFALSPFPSAQLFEAAGLLAVPLLPLTVAFFSGRLISYSFYISAAALAEHSYGQIFTSAIRSPVGIAIEVTMLLAIFALSQVDVPRMLVRLRDRRSADHRPPGR